MRLITRGFGLFSSLITKGFSYSIEIITPDNKVVRHEGGGGFIDDFKKTVDRAIQTSQINVRDPNFRLDVSVTFVEKPKPSVIAKLNKYLSKNKNISVNVTIVKRGNNA